MNKARRKFIIGSLGILSSATFIDGYWFERNIFEENNYSLKSKENFSPLKILQLTDLHLQDIGDTIKALAKRIGDIAPDIICITGDSIDHASNLHLLGEFFKLLPHSILKISIPGNWEHMARVDMVELEKLHVVNNAHLLINKSIEFKIRERAIVVSGVDEYIEGNPDFEKTLQSVRKNDLHILLFHSPGYMDLVKNKLKEEIFKEFKIDLILSGHTHGGQINIFGFIPYLPKGSNNYVKGWYLGDHPPHYVSKGIGTTIIPFRLGARAEIAVFHL